MNLATTLLGPLAGPECRRALGRGWVILVRTLAAVAVMTVVAAAVWWWWTMRQLDDAFMPYDTLRAALFLVESMLLTVALVLGPAVLAGSLAGDKERGVLAVLLTSRVSAREIVLGRLSGKLAQVSMSLLAGVPALVFLAALSGFGPVLLLALVGLVVAIGFGSGGLAVAAATACRRGRDALLTVYLVDLVLLMSPMTSALGLPAEITDAFSALNPYPTVTRLVYDEDVAHALVSISAWAVIGVLGVAYASLRLRRSALAPLDGERKNSRGSRRLWVPAIDEDRPMVWKELFIDRVGTLGRAGRWIGIVLVLGLGLGSVVLGLVFVWDTLVRHGETWGYRARETLAVWVGGTTFAVACLIEWGIGLRAAVSISSERERGTWDALLTSPLEGRAIVIGKLWGSLYALRWLVGATFLAWAVAASVEAMSARDAAIRAVDLLVVGAFMAAVGVRTSLASETATRAMSTTIGIWLGTFMAVRVTGVMLMGMGVLLANSFWFVLAQLGLAPPVTKVWFPLPLVYAWPLALDSQYLGITLMLVADTQLRFDRIAGRMTEGRTAVAFDELLYGRPMAPVFLGDPAKGGEGLIPSEDAIV